MEGRVFDAQVVLSPKDSPVGKLLRQYVCVRITRMDDVDIALFDRDWNNAIYYFVMNADEQIYMRYGGRDAASPDTYLDMSSLALALEKGLELHRGSQEGEIPKPQRPTPLFPRQIPPLVQRTFATGACVECHLIGDYLNIQRETEGKLDKLAHMFRSPDIKTIGIHLDVPRGLVVHEARDAVAAAGMKPGDRISRLNGTPVWTFGDLQYYYDKVDRHARQVQFTVDRNGQPVELAVTLPERWWWTDTTWRHYSVDPRVYFESRPLTAAEKQKLGLDSRSFASQVTTVDKFAVEVLKTHQLRDGDIVAAVDGVDHDDIANTPELYIKLYKKAGSSVTLDVIRDGKRIQMPLKTYRMSFRK